MSTFRSGYVENVRILGQDLSLKLTTHLTPGDSAKAGLIAAMNKLVPYLETNNLLIVQEASQGPGYSIISPKIPAERTASGKIEPMTFKTVEDLFAAIHSFYKNSDDQSIRNFFTEAQVFITRLEAQKCADRTVIAEQCDDAAAKMAAQELSPRLPTHSGSAITHTSAQTPNYFFAPFIINRIAKTIEFLGDKPNIFEVISSRGSGIQYQSGQEMDVSERTKTAPYYEEISLSEREERLYIRYPQMDFTIAKPADFRANLQTTTFIPLTKDNITFTGDNFTMIHTDQKYVVSSQHIAPDISIDLKEIATAKRTFGGGKPV